jgi:DNA-directed RNA polymerase subunit RPC12/RpoP
MRKDLTQIMLLSFSKTHIVCPNSNCECAISFKTGLLETDFAKVEGTVYKYFGALKEEDNIVCKYCGTKLMRGDIVSVMRPTPVGPVIRTPS